MTNKAHDELASDAELLLSLPDGESKEISVNRVDGEAFPKLALTFMRPL